MTFLAQPRLWLLVGVALLLIIYVVAQRRRRRYAVRFTNLALLDSVAPERPGWRRHAPAVLFAMMLVLLIVGFARPATDVEVPRERATVIIALDTSLSMEATDVTPNRLNAAKQAATAFVGRLPATFNVGLVSFSGQANIVVPPTTDRAAVADAIDRLQLGPATAIGEGIYASLDAVRNLDMQAIADPPPARIVLLSDGANTAGRPLDEASAAAVVSQIPVATIAYGTPLGVIRSENRLIPVPVDAEALRQVADVTGGTFAEAATGEELEQVYTDLGSSIGYRTEQREITSWFIGLGLLLATAAAAASLIWFSRLP
jgi:Ca-activated chloride channel family protein